MRTLTARLSAPLAPPLRGYALVCSTPSLHTLYTLSAHSLHTLCTLSAHSLHTLCALSAPSLRPLCTSYDPLHPLQRVCFLCRRAAPWAHDTAEARTREERHAHDAPNPTPTPKPKLKRHSHSHFHPRPCLHHHQVRSRSTPTCTFTRRKTASPVYRTATAMATATEAMGTARPSEAMHCRGGWFPRVSVVALELGRLRSQLVFISTPHTIWAVQGL